LDKRDDVTIKFIYKALDNNYTKPTKVKHLEVDEI